MSSFLAFLGLSVLVIVTPGPDTIVTIRNTLVGGRLAGLATASGIACGQLIWAAFTSLGLIALLLASELLFLALKYAGAAYLVFLGLEALRSAVRPSAARSSEPALPGTKARLRPIAAFRQGLVSDLGNPKMAVFFASLLPQFVPAGEDVLVPFLGLGVVFSAMTLAWLAGYALLLARIGHVLARPALRRWIDGITGTLLIALGLKVAVGER